MSGVLPAVFQRKSRKKRCPGCDYEKCACLKKKDDESDVLRQAEKKYGIKFASLNEADKKFGIKLAMELNGRHGHPRFYELLQEAADLHEAKSQDYGRSAEEPLGNLYASKRIEVDPFMGVMIRMQDKWARIEALLRNNRAAVKTESMVDTLRDLAAYSYLAIILWEEKHGSSAV